MKWPFLYFLIMACSCNPKKMNVDGSYILMDATYGDSSLSKEYFGRHTTLKFCRNGFWMRVTYKGTSKTTVESASGGTYVFNKDQCIEKINFYSQNNQLVGSSYPFNISLRDNRYVCSGMISNEKCAKCVVTEDYQRMPPDNRQQDTALEGVWKLQAGEWFGKKIEDADYTMFKIYAYPYFIWAQYHSKGRDFIGAGGGTFTSKGSKIIEHVEFFSFYDNIPFDLEINVTKLTTGNIQMLSLNGAGKEVWQKVQ